VLGCVGAETWWGRGRVGMGEGGERGGGEGYRVRGQRW